MAEHTTIEEEFLVYTQKAGDISRQLGLAGVAAIWIFSMKHSVTQETFSLSSDFKWPLLLIIISLGIDALQYAVGSIILGHEWFCNDSGSEPAKAQKMKAAILFCMILIKLFIMVAAYIKLFLAARSFIAWN